MIKDTLTTENPTVMSVIRFSQVSLMPLCTHLL